MIMEWNKAQKQAIENRGNNLLVAAAAGSGKTTVLIERIKRLILEDRIPVDRFLIVTFTKAAASLGILPARVSSSLPLAEI